MTDSTDRVLASIDETLDGYVTWDPNISSDAMRWRPEEPAKPQPGKAYWAPAGTLDDDASAWTELGRIADGGFVYPGPSLAERAETARRLNEQLTVTLRANLEAATSAFASVGEAAKQVFNAFKRVADANHPQIAAARYGDDYRRHYRACHLCNPAGNPKPLKVNGTEYQRRTRARRRRNRR